MPKLEHAAQRTSDHQGEQFYECLQVQDHFSATMFKNNKDNMRSVTNKIKQQLSSSLMILNFGPESTVRIYFLKTDIQLLTNLRDNLKTELVILTE